MRRVYVVLAATAAAVAAALLLRFPPERYGFYPRCPVYTWMRLLCPGCGATRALAALLRGQLAQALSDNALFAALLPFLLAYAAVCCARAWRMGEYRWPRPPRWAVPTALALAAVFTVARNLLR